MSDNTENPRNDPAADDTGQQSENARPQNARPDYSRPVEQPAPGQYSRPGGDGPQSDAPSDRREQAPPPYQGGQAYPGSQYPNPGQYGQSGQSGQGAQWWQQQAPAAPHGGAAQGRSSWDQGQSSYGPGQYGGAQPHAPQDNRTTVLERPRKTGRGKLAAGALILALVAGGVGGGVVAAFDDSSTNAVPGALSQTASGQPVATAPDGTVQSVAQAVLPSVVQIQVRSNGSGGEGSGVILSDDGFIMTNNHVVAEAAQGGTITVAFNDGSTSPARIVGRAPSADIAVIKVDKTNLTPIKIGSSSSLAVGQNVVAVGSPLGLAGTVTTGIVSALNRPVSASGESSAQDQSSVIDAVQTDAAINPGNSGGALVNLDGSLIGINSAIASLGASQAGGQSGSIGLGFAIPVDQANRIAQELIRDGVATQAVLGVSVPDVQDVRGATVGEVTPDGAAAKAGIPSGAVITKIDDRVIADSESLVAAVRSYAPGTTVRLEVRENGSTSTKTVTLGSQTVGTR